MHERLARDRSSDRQRSAAPALAAQLCSAEGIDSVGRGRSRFMLLRQWRTGPEHSHGGHPLYLCTLSSHELVARLRALPKATHTDHTQRTAVGRRMRVLVSPRSNALAQQTENGMWLRVLSSKRLPYRFMLLSECTDIHSPQTESSQSPLASQGQPKYPSLPLSNPCLPTLTQPHVQLPHAGHDSGGVPANSVCRDLGPLRSWEFSAPRCRQS